MTKSDNQRSSIFFGLEVTRRCNLKCPHCFTDSSSKAHPGPSLEEFRELFTQLVSVGARHVALSGGEPLMRSDLLDIMQMGRELGLQKYSLVTNGSLAEPERVSQLRKAGLVSVQVSIDGVDRRDHCAIRDCTSQAYYRALNATRIYREAGIKVDVATILVGPNLGRAPEMAMLCQSLGVRKLRYCSFVPTGRAAADGIQDRHAADPARLDAFLEFFRSFRRKKNAPLEMLIDHGIGPWRADGRFRCLAGRDVSYISGEGDLYPCPSLMFDAFKVGNVFETGLPELLASPALHRVRNIQRSELDEPCRSCDCQACSGGCRGAAYAATGSTYAAPAYCNYRRRTALGTATTDHRATP